jgi:hypothetical protein
MNFEFLRAPVKKFRAELKNDILKATTRMHGEESLLEISGRSLVDLRTPGKNNKGINIRI